MNVCSTQPARLSMRSCIRRGVIAFLAVAAVAAAQFCGFPARASQDNALVDLARIREEWVQDLHAKRLEPILKSYAPDAVFLQPNGDRIVGSAALRRRLGHDRGRAGVGCNRADRYSRARGLQAG